MSLVTPGWAAISSADTQGSDISVPPSAEGPDRVLRALDAQVWGA